MRVITLNLNGIRSAARKGFFDWLAMQNADIVCLQEVRAWQSQLTDELFSPTGYHCYYHDAERKGYSGVAIYSREMPQQVQHGIGWADFDAEGRYLEIRFRNLRVVSLYMHSGSSGEIRQAVKYQFMDRFLPWLQAHNSLPWLICGDLNIAHQQIDLKNWRGNRKNSGFLPEERAWMDRLFGEAGFTDAFRVVNPSAEQYTWWSNRGRAWDNNTGWRIDYQVISQSLAPTVRGAQIYKDQRFSDHAPLIMDYDLALEV